MSLFDNLQSLADIMAEHIENLASLVARVPDLFRKVNTFASSRPSGSTSSINASNSAP